MEPIPPARAKPPDTFLDRPAARLAALGVVVLIAAAVATLHRDTLFPPDAAAVAGDDPAAPCIAKRAADIARMLADGTITAGQAGLFESRAEALCRSQAGQTAAPPIPPRD